MPLPWVISFMVVMVLVFMMSMVYSDMPKLNGAGAGYFEDWRSKWSW